MNGNDWTDLQRLVSQLLDLVESGDDDGVESLLAQHPEHEAQAREQLAALAGMGLLQAGEDLPDTIDGFRVLRELGRGGMGVVYLAETPNGLGRCALKVLPREHRYSTEAKLRFHREVEAVARLDHPNIVAIVGHGEHEGLPYFAMDAVDGLGLDRVLGTFPRGTRPDSLSGADFAEVFTRQEAGPVADVTSPATHASNDPAEAPAVFRGSWVDTCLQITSQVTHALRHATSAASCIATSNHPMR